MSNDERFAALLGFAFVAAWAGLGFGVAILCLVGAGVFYAVARFMAGELELEGMRDRVEGARSGFRRPEVTPQGRRTTTGMGTGTGTRVS
jgi:hypothetical protein